jgi:Trypsin-like peptidase domain
MVRFALLLLALIGFAAPARADDITAASRGVVRVVVAAFEGEELVDFSHGSGFAVAPNRIVTNAHVVALAREHPDSYTVGVVPSEGDKSYRARLLAIDPDKDLALLEIVEGSVPPVPLYMGALTDGADVVALGYPGNVDLATAQSMDDFITPAAPARTEGNYSNERRVGGVFALLHTANVARGNSGGPLVDECGRVIGVNSFITGAEEGDSPFGFAISNRELASFLLRARQPFPRISSECVSMADRLRDDRSLEDRAQSERSSRERDAARRAEQQALAENQDARENRAAIALLLGVFGLLAAGAGGLLFARGKTREAYWLAGATLPRRKPRHPRPKPSASPAPTSAASCRSAAGSPSHRSRTCS